MVLEGFASILRCCTGWAVSFGFTSCADRTESRCAVSPVTVYIEVAYTTPVATSSFAREHRLVGM